MDWFVLEGKSQSERIDTMGLTKQGSFISLALVRFYLLSHYSPFTFEQLHLTRWMLISTKYINYYIDTDSLLNLRNTDYQL